MSSGGMLYGGDEIGALVFDPGHHSLRVGYAQEDAPKAEIPAVVGVAPDDSSASTNAGLDIETKANNNNVTQSMFLNHFLLMIFTTFRLVEPAN